MKRILALTLVLLLSLSLLTACGGKKSDKIVIGAIYASIDEGFWGTNYEGFLKRIEELGCEQITLVAEGDANKQNDQMKNLISQKVDAIVVVAVDGSAIVSAVKEAQAAKIPIVMNNRPMQGNEATAEYAILSDNEMMTYNQGTWLAEHARATNQKFNLCLIVGNLADENIVQRANGMRKAVEENPDVLSIVVEVPTKTNDEVLAGVQNAMQAYPTIDTIVIPADGQIPSVQSALEQIDRWKPVGDPKHITFLTFDGHWFAMQGIDLGFVDCTAIQDCYGAGYKSADWAYRLAKGEKPPQLIDLDPGYLAYTENFADVRESVWGWPLYLKNKDA